MKNRFYGLILVCAVLVLFAGCAKKESAEQVKSVVDKSDTAEVKAEKAEQKADGTIYVYSAGPKGLSSGLEELFEQQTGITVELLQSTTGKILSKLEAEKANPVADVVVLASWPSAMGLKEQGLTLSYPNAQNADLLHKGFIDGNSEIFGYSASALGITYNTTLVETIGDDWSSFTDEKWKGQVNIPDPSLSGSAMDFISGYIGTFGESGWELFRSLKDNDINMAGANKAALSPVITGAKSVVLAGVDYMAYSAKAKGEPVDVIYPASGTVVNPRAVMIMKSSKNIPAAKEFIDFMLSDEAQQLVVDAYIIPGRSDVKCDNRVNMEDIKLLSYDWNTMMENQASHIEQVLEIFN